MSYISVIGAGSWGTTLACLLSEKGFDVTLWVHEKDLAEEINNIRTNSTYLPDIVLPDDLKVTHDIEEAIKKARFVLNAVPTQYTRSVFKEGIPYLQKQTIIISVSKGIERGTLLTVSSILKELSAHPVAVLSGPSFAKEVIKKLTAAVTLAAEDKNIGYML